MSIPISNKSLDRDVNNLIKKDAAQKTRADINTQAKCILIFNNHLEKLTQYSETDKNNLVSRLDNKISDIKDKFAYKFFNYFSTSRFQFIRNWAQANIERYNEQMKLLDDTKRMIQEKVQHTNIATDFISSVPGKKQLIQQAESLIRVIERYKEKYGDDVHFQNYEECHKNINLIIQDIKAGFDNEAILEKIDEEIQFVNGQVKIFEGSRDEEAKDFNIIFVNFLEALSKLKDSIRTET